MKKQLTEEQSDLWDQITSDVDEYRGRKVMNEIVEGLIIHPHLIKTAKDTQGFHVLEEVLMTHFGLERVSISRHFETMSYVIQIRFHNGSTQQARIDEQWFDKQARR